MRKSLWNCIQCFLVAIMVARLLIELVELARGVKPKEADPNVFEATPLEIALETL
jgi:hypothetical protein